jgi:hypothetical protein
MPDGTNTWLDLYFKDTKPKIFLSAAEWWRSSFKNARWNKHLA